MEVAQENDDPSYLPSSSAMSGGASPMTRRAMPDVVIKIDDPESEKLMRNGDFEPSKSADNGFCYASQAHNNAEPQVLDLSKLLYCFIILRYLLLHAF